MLRPVQVKGPVVAQEKVTALEPGAVLATVKASVWPLLPEGAEALPLSGVTTMAPPPPPPPASGASIWARSGAALAPTRTRAAARVQQENATFAG